MTVLEHGGFSEDSFEEFQSAMVSRLDPAAAAEAENDPMWSMDSSSPRDWFMMDE